MPLLVLLRMCCSLSACPSSLCPRCWLLWFIDMLSFALKAFLWYRTSKTWSTSYTVCKWSPWNGSASLTAVLPLLFTQLLCILYKNIWFIYISILWLNVYALNVFECGECLLLAPAVWKGIDEQGMLQKLWFRRYLWADAIMTWLPSVPYHRVVVVTVSNDNMKDAHIVITSYDMMTRRQKELKKMNFGMCIMVIRLWSDAVRILQLCWSS